MKPRFKGLGQREPNSSYDAVIIGAGLGGLFCANKLSREGLQVLLVEEHYRVGGYCSAFQREGYTFDAGAHFYPLLGNPRTLTGKVLAELGIGTRWVRMDPVDVFHLPDGTRFEVPADLDVYRRRLVAEFPHEAENLERYFAAAREASMRGLLCYFRGRSLERLGSWRGVTLRDALDRFIGDPRLRLLLSGDCPHWGSPPSRISFAFDSMLRLSYFLGNYYPVGGSQAFANELARRFEEQGGHLLTSSRVHEIAIRDGRAAGITAVTNRGRRRGTRRIAAGTVISNADLRQTVEQLLPARHVDPSYCETIRRLRPSYPCHLTYLGLRGVPAEVLAAARGYYWNSWDAELTGRDGLLCKAFVPTLYEPRMAPPGGQIVILQKVLEIDYEAVTDWAVHKAEIEDHLTAHLERVIPGLGEKTVVKLSASARTAWRYTRNTCGAMLGWEMSPDQLGDGRPGIEGPVANLFLVGHWTRPGGGITPVIISAMNVARAVIGGSAAASDFL